MSEATPLLSMEDRVHPSKVEGGLFDLSQQPSFPETA
jgi:hypothetical protein